jgi:UDP-glucose:(heptosyl)LPS alpha-1,3-glucosyltransferase
MNVAFCYESVLPSRGGCETYIATLARRLAADGHAVHLYACRWDEAALPATLHYHAVAVPACPRFLRPWYFGAACRRALEGAGHQVTIGFDKIWGMDVLYPQGGLYAVSARQNLLKYRSRFMRGLVRVLKVFDPAHRSFLALERRQYLGQPRPLVVAISEMVYRQFQEFYQLPSSDLRLVRLATDADRFDECDRPRRRLEWRQEWGLEPGDTVGLFVGLNYRLKGLEPLLRAMKLVPEAAPLRLLVAGNPHSSEFERLAAGLGIGHRVRFLGYCPDMRNCYFASDFLVHPTFYDPCSHVVLEAMACGLPVITTSYNGASELLHPPREGYVLDDPHDHARMAWALTQLLDPARRTACGQAGRRAASQWTFEHHYRHILAVLNEAVARKKAA